MRFGLRQGPPQLARDAMLVSRERGYPSTEVSADDEAGGWLLAQRSHISWNTCRSRSYRRWRMSRRRRLCVATSPGRRRATARPAAAGAGAHAFVRASEVVSSSEPPTNPPAEGIYVSGLWIDGTRWDAASAALVEPEPSVRFLCPTYMYTPDASLTRAVIVGRVCSGGAESPRPAAAPRRPPARTRRQLRLRCNARRHSRELPRVGTHLTPRNDSSVGAWCTRQPDGSSQADLARKLWANYWAWWRWLVAAKFALHI